jgi:uncharacterized protein
MAGPHSPGMSFKPTPPVAAWRHRGLRDGFEVVFVAAQSQGQQFHGHVAAVEEGQPWAVQYSIVVDGSWKTCSVQVFAWSASGQQQVSLKRSDSQGWLVDGAAAPQLDGCFDVDLEASTLTNALPIQRLQLGTGQLAEVPAAYVRTPDLAVERLEQQYQRISDSGQERRFAYSAPRFDYAGELTYDTHGLLVDYPGLAKRVA